MTISKRSSLLHGCNNYNDNQGCGMRPSVLGQDRSETKKIGLGLAHCGLGLAGLVLCCETRSCHARRHNDLEGHSNFSSTIYSLFWSWNITKVINSGVHLKVKATKCLCLLPVVLVL